MRPLTFATNNQHKLSEISFMFAESGLNFRLLSLQDIGLSGDIPEDHNTLRGNALAKAKWVFDRSGGDVFADDTGLEIDALDGRPGVYSARYAGEGCSFEDNVRKVLEELSEKSLRSARFLTVIALILDGKEYFFEGSVEGEILETASGTEGFGYDPVFRPAGYSQSFADMSPKLKNSISHRARAFAAMMVFLREAGY
jgi:XTP/dITP diphosphohydrolase